MAAPLAYIRWSAPWDDEGGALTVEVEGARIEVQTVDEALAWAAARTDRVQVIVDDLDGVWDAPPPEGDLRRIDAHVARARTRHDAETRTHPAPVAWFFAILDPDVDDVDALCAAAADPRVDGARVHRTTRRRRDETWLVLHIAARSRDGARSIGSDVVLALVRLRPGTSFASTGHQVAGLAEYERDELG